MVGFARQHDRLKLKNLYKIENVNRQITPKKENLASKSHETFYFT